MRLLNQSSKSKTTGGDMNGSTMAVATFMASFGWKMHHLWMHLTETMHFWDQHVSTWHPDQNCPPAAIHPSAWMFNTLQDTKKELAEMLNCLQCHTKCAPGYCEHKKGTGEIFCWFGYPKKCRDNSEISKDTGHEFVELNTRRNDEILNSYIRRTIAKLYMI